MAYLGLLALSYTRIATSAVLDGFMTDVKTKMLLFLSLVQSSLRIDKVRR